MIAESAQIARSSIIQPGVFIGNHVKIGEDCIIHPNVTIYDYTEIGNRVEIHAGSVIGADAFYYKRRPDGYDKLLSSGKVVIEDDVEIGANATVDRATMGSTFIRKGVKLDNLVQIAHNVEVGENTVMAAQVGVAGSAKIGKQVMIGGQAGISGHLHIVNDTKIVAQSGIPSTIKKADTFMGSPGIPLDDFKKSYFGFDDEKCVFNWCLSSRSTRI
jgi:UDP-3-O-[3-hydroxymyristoyl] glucosamine N-acyltransferase